MKDSQESNREAGSAGKPGAGFLPSWHRQEWLLGLLLLAVILVAFGPAWQAGFIWDDDRYVTGNPLLTAPDGLRRIWFSLDSLSQYFPLTYTTFYMERALWGLNPAGYHLVNLLFHAANALLVWRVLTRLRVPGAWLAAAIFALHPVQVESVAWITERKNVLMGFFFLLTLWAWLKFIDDKGKRPWRFYILALVFYALALFAKTTACTLPAALLLILWLRKMPIHWRRLGQVAPFVVMGIGMGLLTVWWERHHQGTQGKSFEIGTMERVLIASRGLWFYLGKLLWPVNLTFSYPRWTISASDPLAYCWVLATAALGVVIWRVRRWTGRSVEVAAVFFAATLCPVLGFIMLYTFVYSYVADHYQYLACIGPIALAAAGMKMGLDRFAAGKRFLQPALCAALLLTLGVLTWQQCEIYSDSKTLWEATLLQNPNSWLAQGELGNLLLQKGQVEDGIDYLQTALKLNPDSTVTHYNLGLGLSLLGREDEAILQYEKAVKLNPDYAEAHNNLCLAYFRKGRLDAALSHGQKAVEIAPNLVQAWNNLGNVFCQLGRMDEAISQYQKALEINPDYSESQKNLAWILATCPQAALRNGNKAVALAGQANELAGGDNPVFLEVLAAAYAEAGRFPEAVETAQRALRLAGAQANTGVAGQLQAQLKLYQTDRPFHGPELAH